MDVSNCAEAQLRIWARGRILNPEAMPKLERDA
jgi:hypothetical protein